MKEAVYAGRRLFSCPLEGSSGKIKVARSRIFPERVRVSRRLGCPVCQSVALFGCAQRPIAPRGVVVEVRTRVARRRTRGRSSGSAGGGRGDVVRVRGEAEHGRCLVKTCPDLHRVTARRPRPPLSRPTSPFHDEVPPDRRRNARWVQPRLVGQVVYRQFTTDHRLRHTSWRGLRHDVLPKQVRWLRSDLPGRRYDNCGLGHGRRGRSIVVSTRCGAVATDQVPPLAVDCVLCGGAAGSSGETAGHKRGRDARPLAKLRRKPEGEPQGDCCHAL
ncbi:MAG: hypothetical protein GEV28_31245 [Actinophytocola sp.]|uniref:ATP dependent DNA ligase n=1 Tax=Actinophytocola sp. TaxID=1872138 RepID=UPI001328405F|nr:hypothetical protein [Actinophytocola sp.]